MTNGNAGWRGALAIARWANRSGRGRGRVIPSPVPGHLALAEAAQDVVVDHADGLHVRGDDGGADESEAAALGPAAVARSLEGAIGDRTGCIPLSLDGGSSTALGSQQARSPPDIKSRGPPS